MLIELINYKGLPELMQKFFHHQYGVSRFVKNNIVIKDISSKTDWQ